METIVIGELEELHKCAHSDFIETALRSDILLPYSAIKGSMDRNHLLFIWQMNKPLLHHSEVKSIDRRPKDGNGSMLRQLDYFVQFIVIIIHT